MRATFALLLLLAIRSVTEGRRYSSTYIAQLFVPDTPMPEPADKLSVRHEQHKNIFGLLHPRCEWQRSSMRSAHIDLHSSIFEGKT